MCRRISRQGRKTNDILRMICGNIIEKMAADIFFHIQCYHCSNDGGYGRTELWCSGCSRLTGMAGTKGIESATARGVLYATAIVSTIEVIRMVMLPADYLRQKFIEPLKDLRDKDQNWQRR